MNSISIRQVASAVGLVALGIWLIRNGRFSARRVYHERQRLQETMGRKDFMRAQKLERFWAFSLVFMGVVLLILALAKVDLS